MNTYDQIARYYDLSHDRLTDDIPFVLQNVMEVGGPVLEVGCGSGRLLVPLARAGFAVTGIDNSSEMLARAEVRLAAEPDEVRARTGLLAADVKSLTSDVGGPFGLIVFGYNTFMHLDESAGAIALQRLRPLLRPGGRLLIDVANPMMLSMATDDPDFTLEDTLEDRGLGEIVRQYTAYQAIPGEQAVDVTWVYEVAKAGSSRGEWERIKVQLRYFYLYPHQYDLLDSVTLFL